MTAQLRLDEIRDLANQWEQLAGFSFVIPDWMIGNMADDQKGISTLYDFGQYIAGQVVAKVLTSPTAYGGMMPWIWYGMSATEYSSKLNAFDSTFRTLTGQSAPSDVIDRALHEHQGTMTGTQFETWVMAQDAIKNQYGWLKYGLDFQQFQTQKLQMRTQFGRDLSDQEAASLLQFHHAAQGPSMGVSAQPTLTQAERKQTQVGLSANVVR